MTHLLSLCHCISTSCATSHSATHDYIENWIAEVYDSGELKVGNQELVEVIKETLKENVQGM